MIVFTFIIPTILISGFIIDSLRPKAQMRPIKVRK